MLDLMIILGSPASGKTTLARRLARELNIPALCKDDVKEALFDVLGVRDRNQSRLLSEASFAAQLRLARTQLEAGLSCLIEGNWRPEHAGAVADILAAVPARTVQVACSARPPAIERRFRSRSRHWGHLDSLISGAELAAQSGEPAPFLVLPGAQWRYDSENPQAYAGLMHELELWRV